jgi:nucleotide-binding universal stress UspA family protein
MEQWEVQWSRNHFKLLSLNATWAIPRSGLIFKKVSHSEMALDMLMPWMEEMGAAYKEGRDVPPDAAELKRHQQLDFETIAERFEAAGINVTDPKGLLHD